MTDLLSRALALDALLPGGLARRLRSDLMEYLCGLEADDEDRESEDDEPDHDAEPDVGQYFYTVDGRTYDLNMQPMDMVSLDVFCNEPFVGLFKRKPDVRGLSRREAVRRLCFWWAGRFGMDERQRQELQEDWENT